MSRKKAKETLALEEYRKSMEGIYTTSVNEHTLDEGRWRTNHWMTFSI